MPLVKWVNRYLRGNIFVFSVLYCGRKFTAVGSVILPYLFSVETFTWHQKTLYQSLTSLLCVYCDCSSKTHTAASNYRVVRTLKSLRTGHHVITKSCLSQCDFVSFDLICSRPKQTTAVMNLFCHSFTCSLKHLMQWRLRCSSCSSVLSIKFSCVQQCLVVHVIM